MSFGPRVVSSGARWVNEIDQAEIVVAEQKRVGAEPKYAAGPAMDEGLAVHPGQKTCDEVVGVAILRRKSHNAIAGSDVWMARPVQRNQEAVAEHGAVVAEVGQPQRR